MGKVMSMQCTLHGSLAALAGPLGSTTGGPLRLRYCLVSNGVLSGVRQFLADAIRNKEKVVMRCTDQNIEGFSLSHDCCGVSAAKPLTA